MCGCCSHGMIHQPGDEGVTRRDFLAGVSAFGAGGVLSTAIQGPSGRPAVAPGGQPAPSVGLKMQPVLTYSTPARRNATSWREWGGVQTDAAAADEASRIEAELVRLRSQADFPLEFLPLIKVKDRDHAARAAAGDHDGVIMYAAGGPAQVLEALALPQKWNLMFLRHRSGPVYLWYEIAHNRFLRKTVDDFGQAGMDVQDIVVDDPGELLWRLRALHGLKNTLGKRIVAVGGASGWGQGGRTAPERARQLWKLEIVEVSYDELGRRIQQVRQNAALKERCAKEADDYLGREGTVLETDRGFVHRAFMLTEVFKDLMRSAQTNAITINNCMGTIMPISETTACLPLSLLNDADYTAFCESDFVVIPSGILLHHISGKPVFLNDPTYPYRNTVTLAHCTAPRKLDGKNREGARILTHFESDYGAAPKVEMRIGQTVTNLIPDFASRRWVAFSGSIVDNPFLDICRSQIDVKINGDCNQLLNDMKGFHWMTCYGDYLRETGYALRKVGVDYVNLSEPSRTGGTLQGGST